MLYGLPGFTITIPDPLYPTPDSQFKPLFPNTEITNQNSPKKKTPNWNSGEVGGGSSARRKKKTKKAQSTVTRSLSKEFQVENYDKSQFSSLLLPGWSKIGSSESEWSDTELVHSINGGLTKHRMFAIKVRRAAVNCLHTTVKVGISYFLSNMINYRILML